MQNRISCHLNDLPLGEIKAETVNTHRIYIILNLGYSTSIFMDKQQAQEIVRQLLMAVQEWEKIEIPEPIGALPF